MWHQQLVNQQLNSQLNDKVLKKDAQILFFLNIEMRYSELAIEFQ